MNNHAPPYHMYLRKLSSTPDHFYTGRNEHTGLSRFSSKRIQDRYLDSRHLVFLCLYPRLIPRQIELPLDGACKDLLHKLISWHTAEAWIRCIEREIQPLVGVNPPLQRSQNQREGDSTKFAFASK